MKLIKIQCECGQRYAFDIEPVNGRMPSSVVCPVCGVDGTAAANEIIAQSQSVATPTLGLKINRMVTPIAHTPSPVSVSNFIRPTILPLSQRKSKLTWYEQLWIALPIALVAIGGAIVGVCGGAAWAINKTVFKKIENPVLRYA